MKLLWAFLSHELRTQGRSLRFRVLAGVYLTLGAYPLVFYHLNRAIPASIGGSSTYAAWSLVALPLLSSVLAAILSVDAISREREEGSLPVVGLAPMTNTGYLVRRFVAVLVIVVPLSAVLPVGAWLLAGSALGGLPPIAPFFSGWLIEVLPVTIASSAVALGLGTITGGTVTAALFGFAALAFFLSIVNNLAASSHRAFAGPEGWYRVEEIMWRVIFTFDIEEAGWTLENLAPATEGAIDGAIAFEQLAPQAAIGLAFSILSFGLAVGFLRRTRPNVRPWRIRADHPLRTYHKMLNRLREEYSPDPAWAKLDRAFVLGAIVFAILVSSWLVVRFDRFRDRAKQRYLAEKSGKPEPTPFDLRVTTASLRSRIESTGSLVSASEFRLENEGSTPADRAAFQLDPSLRITTSRVDRGSISWSRSWDRAEATFSPPLGPGEGRTLEIELAGTPFELAFELMGPGSFYEQFDFFERQKHASGIPDFSRSVAIPRVSRRRIEIDASALLPVLRYATWQLTPPKDDRDPGFLVPDETFFPNAELDVEIETPFGSLVADSCGHIAAASPSGKIVGTCRTPIGAYRLRGGPFVSIGSDSGIGVVAVLPAHRAIAAIHLPSLSDAAERSRQTWPGIDPFRSAVLLEWPPEQDLDPFTNMTTQDWQGRLPQLEVHGKLFLLPERILVTREPLVPDELAIDAIATELSSHRPLAPGEAVFLRRFMKSFATARLGKPRSGGAVVSVSESGPSVTESVLEGRSWSTGIWYSRLPALLVDLEHRVGSRTILESIDELVRQATQGPATAKELFEILSRRSGKSVATFFDDYIIGKSRPTLELQDVTSRRIGPEWIVEGVVANRETGEAFCPVELRTDVEPITIDVVVGSKGSAPFRFRTRYTPRTVLLDPASSCYRLAYPSLNLRVEIGGES